MIDSSIAVTAQKRNGITSIQSQGLSGHVDTCRERRTGQLVLQDKDCTVRFYDNSNGIKTHFSLVNIYQHFFSEIKSHGGSPEDLVSVEPSCQAELILCELGSNIQYVHGYLSHCVLLSEQ